MKRIIAGGVALVLAAQAVSCTPAQAQSASFEEAKKDASKRASYVAQLLGRHVGEKGLAHGWYAISETDHANPNCHCGKCALDAVRQEYRKDGREFYFEREIKGVLATVESAPLRVLPFYREDAVAGNQMRAGLLLVGDLFTLASEDEVKSVTEDFVLTVVKIREDGLKTKDRELDANIPALKVISHVSLIKLWAQSVQLENIFNKTRKVSNAFREEAIKQYLATHKVFSLQLLKEHKVYDDNNENTLQKEIIDYLDFMYAFLHERIAAVGYEHKLVDKATQEYKLEPKK